MVRSRERYRAANQALSGLNDSLQKYDELLRQFQGELIAAIDELGPAIERPPKRALTRGR
jgi:hypothetical protein